jgi:hypothetical protein
VVLSQHAVGAAHRERTRKVYSTASSDKTLQSAPQAHQISTTTRRVCLRNDCPFVTPDDRCKKPDCGVEPPPTCSRTYTSDEPLGRCDGGCNWVGTAEDWLIHDCEAPKGAEFYSIPSPRVAEHVIELLDTITLKPHDPHHVLCGHSEIPITNVGVLRLLNRPLDQRTTAAITTELARISESHIRSARYVGTTNKAVATMTGQDPPDVDDTDWADFDRGTRIDAQRDMRRHIADQAAVTA